MEKTEKDKSEELKFHQTWWFSLAFMIFLVLAFRSLVYSPFHIPSGSMKSGLLTGDYIFVSKYAYGYSRYSFPLGFLVKWFDGKIAKNAPRRGDIIVFRHPKHFAVDYIKRLVGLPGDRIQVINGELYINEKKLDRKRIEDFTDDENQEYPVKIRQYTETNPEGREYIILDQKDGGNLDNTEEYIVPSGHYFFMGDNRDNSADSRVLNDTGYIPEANLIGRAELVFFSCNSLWKFWKWPTCFRGERFLKVIK